MVQINPNNSGQKGDYRDTLNRFTGDKSEKDGIELLFKLADTNKDGNVDDAELRTLENNLSEKSIFGDGVFDKKEFKNYVKDYNKQFESDEALMLEFSKGDFEKLKDMKGISKSMFDKFIKFCNIRLGNGDVNDQVGINGKLSSDPNVTTKQDQTGDCYLLTSVNLLAKANDGDLSDYIKPDGQGGGIISYRKVPNFLGKKFDVTVSEKELAFARKYQKDNPVKYRDQFGNLQTIIGPNGQTYSILSKGDDDVFALELAEIKQRTYSRVRHSFGNPNTPMSDFLKAKKDELWKSYINGLSAGDKKELSRAILSRQKLEEIKYDGEKEKFVDEKIEKLISSHEVSEKEMKEFKLDETMAQQIENNPLALKFLRGKFPKCFTDENGNDKETIDKDSIDRVNSYIAGWAESGLSKKDISDLRINTVGRLLQIIKAEDKVLSTISVSDNEIKEHEITQDNWKYIYYLQNEKTEAICEKLDTLLMEQLCQTETLNGAMLEDNHKFIKNGGRSNDYLSKLAGAESITYDWKSAKADCDERLAKWINPRTNKPHKLKDEHYQLEVLSEFYNWINTAREKGYQIGISMDMRPGSHAVLLKGYDAQRDKLYCYNPWNMNRVETFDVEQIRQLQGIKLPPKEQ